MIKVRWRIQFSIICSVITFIIVLIAYPQTIIHFFIDQKHSSFFIADLNVFIHRFIYSNGFFTYRVYIPFIVMRLIFTRSKCLAKEVYYFYAYFRCTAMYLHIISAIFNHYDFADFGKFRLSTFFEAKTTNFDCSYLLIQYYGFYWDFFATRMAYCILCNLIIGSSTISLHIVHTFSIENSRFICVNYINFWNVFYLIWISRFIRYSRIFYFFCGSGFRSDWLVIIVTIVIYECTLFVLRFFITIQLVKLYTSESR